MRRVNATSYDDVYSLFLSNTMIDELFLPKDSEQIYDLINSATNKMNNRLGKKSDYDTIECIDGLEMFQPSMDNEVKIILAQFMKVQAINNILTYKSSVFTTFTKEIGIRNINAQMASLSEQLEKEKIELDVLVQNYDDDISIM